MRPMNVKSTSDERLIMSLFHFQIIFRQQIFLDVLSFFFQFEERLILCRLKNVINEIIIQL